eukprot:710631-Amphidinium_carterae.1
MFLAAKMTRRESLGGDSLGKQHYTSEVSHIMRKSDKAIKQTSKRVKRQQIECYDFVLGVLDSRRNTQARQARSPVHTSAVQQPLLKSQPYLLLRRST